MIIIGGPSPILLWTSVAAILMICFLFAIYIKSFKKFKTKITERYPKKSTCRDCRQEDKIGAAYSFYYGSATGNNTYDLNGWSNKFICDECAIKFIKINYISKLIFAILLTVILPPLAIVYIIATALKYVPPQCMLEKYAADVHKHTKKIIIQNILDEAKYENKYVAKSDCRFWSVQEASDLFGSISYHYNVGGGSIRLTRRL